MTTISSTAWRNSPLPVRCFVVFGAFGFIVGTAIAIYAGIVYLNADPDIYPPRFEILEGAVLISVLVGFPTSMALGWLEFLGLPGWILLIVLAPTLNFGLVGVLAGGTVALVQRARDRSHRGVQSS